MMKRLLSIAFLVILFQGYSQIPYDFVGDLKDRWMIEQDGKLVPYTGNQTSNVIHFNLDRSDCLNCQLLIESGSKGTLYIDHQPVTILEAGSHFFSHDSLISLAMKDHALVSYFSFSDATDLTTYLVKDQISLERFRSSAEIFSTPLKKDNEFGQFFIIAIILILVLFTILQNLYPRLSADFFSISRTVSSRNLDEVIFKLRFTEKYNLWVITLHAIVFSFLLLTLGHLTDGLFIPYFNIPESLIGSFAKWLGLTMILIFLIISQSVLLSVINAVFGFDFRSVHFYNHIRYSAIIGGVFLVLLFVFYQGFKIDNSGFYTTLVYIITGLLVLRLFFLFQKLMSSRSNTILHLFSYLCATELIPLVIVIKVLFRG
jgi:hypothetical protein